MNSSLRRLRLLFTVHVGDQGDVDQREVLMAHAELKLPHGLDERRRLNIADGASELGWDEVVQKQ
jgi:hypothetical protein